MNMCRICGKASNKIGYCKGDPILSCGHVQLVPTQEEMAREAAEEAERQIGILMRQHGITHDEAESLFIEQATAELSEDITTAQKEAVDRMDKVPENLKQRRVTGRKKRFTEFNKRPRWVGPLVDPMVRSMIDEEL
jgi:hypothetical protein